MTSGSSMHAMNLTAPPHCSHTSISIRNTRLRRRAQVIARCFSAAGSGFAAARRVPRPAGVISARQCEFGANTPWNRVRFTRGRGTNAARRAMKSSGSNKTCVVPSCHGVFSEYRINPPSVTDRRGSATAARLMYRHSRSNLTR